MFSYILYDFLPQDANTDDPVGGALVATHPGLDVAVLFYITAGNSAGIFKLGICNGQMRIALPVLNYHIQNTYVLTVEARANGLITSATPANITISVINVPHVPVFVSSVCVMSVNENGTFLLCLIVLPSLPFDAICAVPSPQSLSGVSSAVVLSVHTTSMGVHSLTLWTRFPVAMIKSL